MPLINVANTGQIGVIKDLSDPELPENAWTDCQNIRFQDGLAHQSPGHSEIYASPSVAPQHIFPLEVAGVPCWIYLSAAKAFVVKNVAGTITHTDITHVTPLTGVAGAWTSTLLSGVPIINAGNEADVPAAWDLDITHKFVDLTNWPANTYCKSLRAFKNYLVALNVTKTTTNYPFLVMWSTVAVPGSLPSSWVPAATNDAGEVDLADGFDEIIDGMMMRDALIIYKGDSTWAMTYAGGQSVFAFRKLFSTGLINRNCVAEFDGMHLAVTRSDVIIHDGNTPVSVLDKQTRRFLFDDIDEDGQSKIFVVKHPYFNEIFICYPALGSSVCDKAMIWNYRDKTVSFRSLPNANHAAFGRVNVSIGEAWDDDSDTWDNDFTSWQKGDFIPGQASVVMASNDSKLFLLDSTPYYDGEAASAYLERRGLYFGQPDLVKLVRGIRPRIKGQIGGTVKIKVGYSDDPYDEPNYTEMTHTIGSTIANDCLVSGRYIAVRFESDTATNWRLDGYQVDIKPAGAW
jgi:hypothetical protein